MSTVYHHASAYRSILIFSIGISISISISVSAIISSISSRRTGTIVVVLVL